MILPQARSFICHYPSLVNKSFYTRHRKLSPLVVDPTDGENGNIRNIRSQPLSQRSRITRLTSSMIKVCGSRRMFGACLKNLVGVNKLQDEFEKQFAREMEEAAARGPFRPVQNTTIGRCPIECTS